MAWASESEYGLGWSGGRRVAAGKRWEHAGWGGWSERGRESERECGERGSRGSRQHRAVVSEREASLSGTRESETLVSASVGEAVAEGG